MKCNVGKTDKIFRWIIGLIVVLIGVYLRSWWGLLGLIPIVTAFIGLCPLYLPFGINTCKMKNK